MTGFAPVVVTQDDADDGTRWRGVARVRGPEALHLPFLTLGLFGISLFWSAEMTQASPYLLSLGVSKSAMSIILMAGPMAGLLVQPIVGVLSDNCMSSWGRRAPYMFAGTILSILAMLLMGYTEGFAALFTGKDSPSHDRVTMIFGILSLWIVDFSINGVQAVDRALVVDTLPPDFQSSGSAWAAKMMGFGGVAGFFIGEVDMSGTFSFLGSKQLQKISCIVSIMMLVVHVLVSLMVQERVLLRASAHQEKKTIKQEMMEIVQNILTLPRIIKQICFIQLFAWIGWFPVLFYSTTYIGDLYNDDSSTSTAIEEEGTRLGSRALFYNALVALAANFILPAFVIDSRPSDPDSYHAEFSWTNPFRVPPRFKIHLATMWAYSHVLFFLCMMGTFVTDSINGATTLLTVSGISWAVTQWAPYSLLGEAILTDTTHDDIPVIMLGDARGEELRLSDERENFLPKDHEGQYIDDEDDNTPNGDIEDHPRNTVMGNHAARTSSLSLEPSPANARGGLKSKAGIILGIHNIFIVIPQFIVTALSSIIFAIMDSGRHGSSEKNDAISSREAGLLTSGSNVAYVFRIGGFSAAIAFYLSWKLSKELRHL